MKYLKQGWDELKGYKTYAVALVAILYGLLYHDTTAVLIGLTGFNLRNGLTTEVAKYLTRKKK